MVKFHINKHGLATPCKAEKGKCPYGGDSGNEGHFDNLEDAEKEAEKRLSEEHGLLSNMPTDRNIISISSATGYEKELIGKKVTVIGHRKDIYEGVVVRVNHGDVKVKFQDEKGITQSKSIRSHRIEEIQVESEPGNEFVKKSNETIDREYVEAFDKLVEEVKGKDMTYKRDEKDKPSVSEKQVIAQEDIKNKVKLKSLEGFENKLKGKEIIMVQESRYKGKPDIIHKSTVTAVNGSTISLKNKKGTNSISLNTIKEFYVDLPETKNK